MEPIIKNQTDLPLPAEVAARIHADWQLMIQSYDTLEEVQEQDFLYRIQAPYSFTKDAWGWVMTHRLVNQVLEDLQRIVTPLPSGGPPRQMSAHRPYPATDPLQELKAHDAIRHACQPFYALTSPFEPPAGQDEETWDALHDLESFAILPAPAVNDLFANRFPYNPETNVTIWGTLECADFTARWGTYEDPVTGSQDSVLFFG